MFPVRTSALWQSVLCEAGADESQHGMPLMVPITLMWSRAAWSSARLMRCTAAGSITPSVWGSNSSSGRSRRVTVAPRAWRWANSLALTATVSPRNVWMSAPRNWGKTRLAAAPRAGLSRHARETRTSAIAAVSFTSAQSTPRSRGRSTHPRGRPGRDDRHGGRRRGQSRSRAGAAPPAPRSRSGS